MENELEKMPTWQIVKLSFKFCLQNLVSMIKLALVPVLLLSVISLMSEYYFVDSGLEDSNSIDLQSIAMTILEFSTYAVAIPFITAWHRLYLIDGYTPKWFEFTVGRKELKYLILLVGLELLFFLSGIIDSIVVSGIFSDDRIWAISVGLFSIILITAWVIYLFRFILLFPAFATGAAMTFKESWYLTANRFWDILAVYVSLFLSIFMITFVANLIFSMGKILYELIMLGHSKVSFSFHYSLTGFSGQGLEELSIWLPIQVLITALTVTCLSVMFKFLLIQSYNKLEN